MFYLFSAVSKVSALEAKASEIVSSLQSVILLTRHFPVLFFPKVNNNICTRYYYY